MGCSGLAKTREWHFYISIYLCELIVRTIRLNRTSLSMSPDAFKNRSINPLFLYSADVVQDTPPVILLCPYKSWNVFSWDLDWRIIARSVERWQENQIICVKLWLNLCVVYSLRPEAWDVSNSVTKISTRLNWDCNTVSPL